MARIAITGHSAGIGQAFAKIYKEQGHEVVGLSRRNGFNIRNIPKLLGEIGSCDIFINNAQVGFAQTELLFAVHQTWQGVPNKQIISISTLMTSLPSSCIQGLDMLHYHVQKTTLEEAVRQLRGLQDWPKLCLIKPGKIDTQGQGGVNVDAWAKKVLETIDTYPEMEVEEIGIGEYLT
jgi:hypothetical protein